MNFVVQNTRERRTFLEENRDFKKEDFQKRKKTIPGKLDHATVVAYEVGHFQRKPLKLTFQDKQGPKQKQSNGDKKVPTTPSEQNEVLSLYGILK